jgi:hypothetical protein
MLELILEGYYDLLDSKYNKNKDLSLFYSRLAIKYLMVRSLKKENLTELLFQNNILFHKKDNININRKKLFEYIHQDIIIKYLLNKKEYMSNEIIMNLKNELKKVCKEKCGIYNDDLNTTLNRIVRDPNLYKLELLNDKLLNLNNQLETYIKWQWYNQKCSDLNEDVIKKQENIIPTLRPISKIDFFVKIEDIIFPFDLKTTVYPKTYKKINIQKFIENENEHFELLKWLYQEQNPRLFCNNYRYFIILIQTNDIENSRNLKCETDVINEKISNYFQKINKNNIVDIEYEYTKDKSLSGVYKTKCLYTLVYK